MPQIRLATDVGGTFTDLVFYEVDAARGVVDGVQAVKAHTTPPNFEKGVLAAVEKAEIDEQSIDFFAHGTTVVINALTERKGVKTALITTKGFRDILEIARGNRPDFFNLRYEKPEPFIPRYLRQEVSERLTYRGDVLEPLSTDGLSDILDSFKAEGVDAIAICLLHSYANPAHEIALEQAIREYWPEVSTVCSHQITREWREYERSNTTALCAYVRPIAVDYLTRMENELHANGFDGSFYVMQSNGGIDTLSSAKATPITMVESGPASGVLGAAALGNLIGEKNIIALDIGGTTAKCSLIDNGNVEVTSQYMIEKSQLSAGYPIMTPVVDIVEIGNGGGSIAWVDEDDKMHVGPKSAGALPGPVAYGKGGTEPTTTDANLMLARINPQYFIGGEIEADMSAVERSFDAIGKKLGLSATEAARGVVRIANHNMISALKLVSINRGYDPRDFTMVAFGGGGAMHATALAKELSIPKVIIPAHSAVFSAWGMLMSDLRRDYVRTHPIPITNSSAAELNSIFQEMESEAEEAYRADDIDASAVRFERFVDLRYDGQEHSVRVPIPNSEIDSAEIEATLDRFQDAYEKEYTYRLEAGINLVSFHLVAYAEVERPEMAKIRPLDSLQDAVKEEREVDFDEDGIHMTTIYNRDLLGSGAAFSGPAIVEESGSSTVIFPDQTATVDDYGNIHIHLSAHD